MKKVFKYATGEEIPKGAKYLTSFVEEKTIYGITENKNFRFVWHYFLVEESDK